MLHPSHDASSVALFAAKRKERRRAATSLPALQPIIPTLGAQSSSDQRAALPALPCHPAVWSEACGAVPIHVIARARSARSNPPRQREPCLSARCCSALPAGVRARRRWPRYRHAGQTSVRRAIGAAPATALRSAPAASCALRQR